MAIFRDSHPTQQISGKRSGHGSWRERRWSSAKHSPHSSIQLCHKTLWDVWKTPHRRMNK